MKNIKTTLFLAVALLGAFSLLSFRPAVNLADDTFETYCDSTEKSILAVALGDSTEQDSLVSSIELLQALGDTVTTDSLAFAYQMSVSACDTTEKKKDDEESLYNLVVLESFASDSTETDTTAAV